MRAMSRVRRAVEADIAELVRLRALLFDTLGGEFFNPPSSEQRWRETCAAVLAEQLPSATMRILVVDGDAGLAACGIGTVARWLPGPHLPTGWIGHVSGVITDPRHRRQGHARAIMRGLLDWFDECGASRVDLHASADSEPLYRELGFRAHPDPTLSWRP